MCIYIYIYIERERERERQGVGVTRAKLRARSATSDEAYDDRTQSTKSWCGVAWRGKAHGASRQKPTSRVKALPLAQCKG